MAKIKEIKSFTIDRSKWYRGNHADCSKLLITHDDICQEKGCQEPSHKNAETMGKMCCLGIYLLACGVPKKLLANVGSPDYIPRNFEDGAVPEWLVADENPTILCDHLMTTNDSIDLSEDVREASIKEDFATVGIKVRFK